MRVRDAGWDFTILLAGFARFLLPDVDNTRCSDSRLRSSDSQICRRLTCLCVCIENSQGRGGTSMALLRPLAGRRAGIVNV